MLGPLIGWQVVARYDDLVLDIVGTQLTRQSVIKALSAQAFIGGQGLGFEEVHTEVALRAVVIVKSLVSQTTTCNMRCVLKLTSCAVFVVEHLTLRLFYVQVDLVLS